MEIQDSLRNTILTSIQSHIDGNPIGTPGRIEFYDNTGVLLVTAMFNKFSMIITRGIGLFINTIPYLRGNIVTGGTAYSWAILNATGDILMIGSCGDRNNLNHDIIFDSRVWSVGDVVVVTDLTLTVPSGSNSYITDEILV